jgi:hypothetical protein
MDEPLSRGWKRSQNPPRRHCEQSEAAAQPVIAGEAKQLSGASVRACTTAGLLLCANNDDVPSTPTES